MRICLSWLNEWVNLSNVKPEELAERLTLAGLEVKLGGRDPHTGEQVFETEVTTNRPDWLSHRGVAREIAAVLKRPLKSVPFHAAKKRAPAKNFSVLTQDPKGCPYYSAVLLQDIESPETPDWMARRLAACGLRPIHFLVDVTNYVLLEWGQPLHAFDLERLSGTRLEARRARAGESLTAIDGRSYPLKPEDVVIADGKGPVALGGLMGGVASEVSGKTRSILLESAWFDPRAVRRTSLRLALRSESSYRFERGVDPEGVEEARQRAVYLITQHAKVRSVSAVLRSGGLRRAPRSITFDYGQGRRWLGADLQESEVKETFKRLGLRFSAAGKRSVRVSVPSWRGDLARPIDLLEEVARLRGYERIEGTLPAREPLLFPVHPLLDLEERVRDAASGLGLSEAVTFSLVSKKAHEPYWSAFVELSNPQSEARDALRPSLVLSLAEAVAGNVRLGNRDVRLYEVAKTYQPNPGGKLPHERATFSMVLSGSRPSSWMDPARAYTLFDLKGIAGRLLESLHLSALAWRAQDHPVLEPSRALALEVSGRRVGFAGEVCERACKGLALNDPVFAFELDLEELLPLIRETVHFDEPARTPATRQDMAFVIHAAVPVGDVMEELAARGGRLLKLVELLDVYEGEHVPKGKKSLAFALHYQDRDRTLTTEEALRLHAQIFKALQDRFQVTPR